MLGGHHRTFTTTTAGSPARLPAATSVLLCSRFRYCTVVVGALVACTLGSALRVCLEHKSTDELSLGGSTLLVKHRWRWGIASSHDGNIIILPLAAANGPNASPCSCL